MYTYDTETLGTSLVMKANRVVCDNAESAIEASTGERGSAQLDYVADRRSGSADKGDKGRPNAVETSPLPLVCSVVVSVVRNPLVSDGCDC